MFIYIVISLLLPTAYEGLAKAYGDSYPNEEGRRLTREYHLRQGALRGFIVKPSRQNDLQPVEIFLSIPYAAPPTGSLRFMPPVSAPPWSGVKIATQFAPVCPQSLPTIRKDNPPSRGRSRYLERIKPFLKQESEDCLYLNIYVPYREQKSKKFPILVFIHGDSFEWSSGNPYDGRILSSYGNVMVITINYRLGILGFMKPSLTEHVYGNNGLLDQLAALQWIKDNIEDLNGDPRSVTVMGHGTGAACASYLMLSPISSGLFHRAILMSGSALSDWSMTKDPTPYTLQVAQSLGCNPISKELMSCLQNKPLGEIKKVQILSREFETPLGPIVAGSFIPNEAAKTVESYPNLLSKYQLLSGVVELESYHEFGALELDHGVLENQRDDLITKFSKMFFDGGEDIALKDILKQYAPSKSNPQSWSVEANRDVILNLFSDSRTLAPMIRFINYHAKANRQSYFYVFGHNSISTEYAALNKSVNGEEMPYVLGVPLGEANTHFHSEYTQKERLLSEVMMRLWTNFVKIGTPNTQMKNQYYTLDEKHWNQYNVEWPEYNVVHQSYLKLDIPPYISSLYRSNYTSFWIETLPNKLRNFIIDPLFEYSPFHTTHKPKTVTKSIDKPNKLWLPNANNNAPHYGSFSSYGSYGNIHRNPPSIAKPNTNFIYNEIKNIKTPDRPTPTEFIEQVIRPSTTMKTKENDVVLKTSSATITLVVTLCVLFIAVNLAICVIIYYKKRKSKENVLNDKQSKAEVGEVDLIGQKSSKGDKKTLRTFKNGYSVIKSINLKNRRNSSFKTKRSRFEPCKTPKSDDSGGFRERFKLRRHLSTSTLDAQTKVRDWITNGIIHRCSPNILRKSDLVCDKDISMPKPYTRSEELLSVALVTKNDTLIYNKKPDKDTKRNPNKTPSVPLPSVDSSVFYDGKQLERIQDTKKTSDSLESKSEVSIHSKKVSVAIDATPAARTNSVLNQEPIELSKSFDVSEEIHSKYETLERSETECNNNESQKSNVQIYTNKITLSLKENKPLQIAHKHSLSDPVADHNYEKLLKEHSESEKCMMNVLPPVSFRNEINVTSRDESEKLNPLSPSEALLTIQKRNFPKVLPDIPKSQKRLSLQTGNLRSFENCVKSIDYQADRRIPPQPPPRVSTLDRRIAFKNTKQLSSFECKNINKYDYGSLETNYENIENFPSRYSTNKNISNESDSDCHFRTERIANNSQEERTYPKIIIASSHIPESNIIIKSSSKTEIPANAPRVRVPDDFHSQTTGSITSFSSFCSDDDIDETDDVDGQFEDTLIQELVGGVDFPMNMDRLLDSKGPETVLEKRLEIVPVKINTVYPELKNNETYICVSDLQLPDINDLEKTAQIKKNLGLNKLQNRSEKILKPPEKAMKIPQKRSSKTSLIKKGLQSKKQTEKNELSSFDLEHSTSGSSNDTETSTGTVKKVELLDTELKECQEK